MQLYSKMVGILTFLLILGLIPNSPLAALPESDNTQFGVVVLHTLPDSVNSKMSLSQIAKSNTELDAIRVALLKSIKQSIFPILRSASAKVEEVGASGDIDIQAEVVRSVSVLVANLKKNLKTLKPKSDIQFGIMIVPTFTAALKAKQLSDEEVPFKFLYGSDRFSVFEPMVDIGGSAQSFLNNEVYEAALRVLYDHRIAQPQDPVLVTVSMMLTLKPVIDDSFVALQSVIGLPLGKRIEFSKNTDQIALTHALLPDPGFNPSLVDAAKSEQPCAFQQLVVPFNATKDIVMHMTFGPIGTFDGTFWKPSPDKKEVVKYVPKLFGKPKFKGKEIPGLDVGFSLTMLSMNMTRQKVEDMDLYLSIGTPKIKVGNFNKPDIDAQFQGEINKAIQEQIANLGPMAQSKVENAAPEMIQSLMSKMFEKRVGK